MLVLTSIDNVDIVDVKTPTRQVHHKQSAVKIEL